MARTKAKKRAGTPIPKKKASSPILKKKVISKTKQATKAKEAEKQNPYKREYAMNSGTTRKRVRFQEVEEPKSSKKEDKKKEKSRKRVKEEESESAEEAEKAGKRSKGGAATKKKREEEVEEEEEEEREEEVTGFFVKCPRKWPKKIMEFPDAPDPVIVYHDDYDESQHIRLKRRTCTLDGIPFKDLFGSVRLRISDPDTPRKPVVRNLMADFAAAREEESADEPPPTAADATPAKEPEGRSVEDQLRNRVKELEAELEKERKKSMICNEIDNEIEAKLAEQRQRRQQHSSDEWAEWEARGVYEEADLDEKELAELAEKNAQIANQKRLIRSLEDENGFYKGEVERIVEIEADKHVAVCARDLEISELKEELAKRASVEADLKARVAELEQKTNVQGGSGDAEKPPTFALTAARTHSGRRTE